MSYLSYLKEPKQKQKLNALLHIYELYKDVIYNYLNNPTNPSTKNLNIFYIRELKPTILNLVKELHLDAMIARKEIELSKNYILFTSLLVAEKELQDQGRDSEYARKEVTYNYGKIKELAELAVAVSQDPIPEIEEIIDEGRRLINALEPTQSKQKSPEKIIDNKDIKEGKINIFPYKLPRGTRWESFIIEFLNDKDIKIEVKGRTHTTNYKEMGFIGKGKNPEPSEAWTFLKVLAMLHGEITKMDEQARDKYKKQKEILSENLEDYFLIRDDPFYPYERTESYKKYEGKKRYAYSKREVKSYRIRIVLIPPPVQEGEPDPLRIAIDLTSPPTLEKNDVDVRVKEYLNEQYPGTHKEDEDS